MVVRSIVRCILSYFVLAILGSDEVSLLKWKESSSGDVGRWSMSSERSTRWYRYKLNCHVVAASLTCAK